MPARQDDRVPRLVEADRADVLGHCAVGWRALVRAPHRPTARLLRVQPCEMRRLHLHEDLLGGGKHPHDQPVLRVIVAANQGLAAIEGRVGKRESDHAAAPLGVEHSAVR
eukprot:scaffold2459_cov72-Phaeocystis_antarctica.AAC.9